jgi:predicted acetyltransferase
VGREPLDRYSTILRRARKDDSVASDVQLVPAGIESKEVVRRLLEFNAYDFSRLTGADLDRDGRFGYRLLNEYWTDPARHAFLIEVGGHIAGLVLVRRGEPSRIAEFLVLPRFRRAGIGTSAARQAFTLFPGSWEIHEIPGNDAAVEFWRRAIPMAFEESGDAAGTTQRFTLAGA